MDLTGERPVSPAAVLEDVLATELDTNVAIDGGDVWSGQRVTSQELRDICELATSTSKARPIIAQFDPTRNWLWRQWSGTIIADVLPREVLFNTALALLVTLFLRTPSLQFAWRAELIRNLASVDQVWLLTSGIVSFTLSFFLTQSYNFFREVYSVVRRVQGRLNDLGLLCATSAARDENECYTEESEQLLLNIARYVRLFTILLYSSVSTQFAPTGTPSGLKQLVLNGALTEEERVALLRSSTGHNAVLGWISALVTRGIEKGLLGDGATSTKTALLVTFHGKLSELRSTYASINDMLCGRMPLAYAQLVQILTDLQILFTPLALMHAVGGVGAVVGTAVVTLFNSSILNLAKLLLDPFGNVAGVRYGRQAGLHISVSTLIIETNVASERWRLSGEWVPRRARRTEAEKQ